MDPTSFIGIVAVGLASLVIGAQVLVRLRARALIGAPVPPLPGPVGEAIGRSPRVLLYFFSPGCAACALITPKVRELQRQHPGVFSVDVSRDLSLASPLHVMATPTTIEIAGGKIVGYHVGVFPPELLSRFAAPEADATSGSGALASEEAA